MVGRKKQKNTKVNGPGMAQEIRLNNNLIEKLFIKEGKRIDYKVVGPDYPLKIPHAFAINLNSINI
jgi:hypothetical protein